MSILYMFIGLVIMVLAGVPVAFALGLTAVITVISIGRLTLLAALCQSMYQTITSFPLLAIPFFLLAGNLMNTGGMTQRIFRWANCVVGPLPGGLGHVNVVASMIFAGMSGSAVADAGGLGTIEIKAMTEAGYDKRFSAGITAASSTIGPIIPPSIPFVLYGGITGVSAGRLFMGGIIPGISLGLALMLGVYIVAKKRKFPRRKKASIYEFLRATWAGLPAVGTPLIIVGGIITGLFTPTEAAIVACIYAMFVGIFIYRELDLKKVLEVVQQTLKQTAQIMFIIGAAAMFGWVLIYLRGPETIVKVLTSLTTERIPLTLLMLAILGVLGCFMETLAIMMITVPLLAPLANSIGIDPVHFGVFMVFTLMVGLITPPVGMSLYAVSAVSDVSIIDIAREAVPYILLFIPVAILIALVPQVTLTIPNLVMGK